MKLVYKNKKRPEQITSGRGKHHRGTTRAFSAESENTLTRFKGRTPDKLHITCRAPKGKAKAEGNALLAAKAKLSGKSFFQSADFITAIQ